MRQRIRTQLDSNTRGRPPLPVSLWNIARVPEVVQSAWPLQPTLGSSMRPSTFLMKKPAGVVRAAGGIDPLKLWARETIERPAFRALPARHRVEALQRLFAL